MIVTREREKLINAILFFVQNTRHCHTLKLFKLLNFLDFEHFRQTGKMVTGLNYVAWENGPAPSSLWHEMQAGGGDDLQHAIAIINVRDETTDRLVRRDLRPKRPVNMAVFSRRERQIMERLAEFFQDLKGENMSEFSHGQRMPWRTVFKGGKGKGRQIDPELALLSDPIVHDAPTIEREELENRRALLANL